MQNSKKIINRVLLIVLVAIFVAAGVYMLKFCFSGEMLTEMYIDRVEQLEANHDDVDLFFVGGSRVYRSFDPDIFDEVLGVKNTTNSGTPAQRPPLTYHLVKDFLERFNPKCVIVGATYNGMQYEQTKSTVSMAMDRMNFANRIQSLVNLYGFDGFLVATGKSEYLSNLNIEEVKDRIAMKSAPYKEKQVLEEETHKSNGFSGEYKSLKPGSITSGYDSEGDGFDVKDIDADTMAYYDKIIKLCKEKDIRVIMITGPCTLFKLYRVNNYQGAVDFFNEYAEKNGIEYYNLNYIKDREDILPDNLFKDKIHLNYEGGQRISKIFANILKEDLAGKDISYHFYKNLEELKKDVHRIVCCFCKAEYVGNEVQILLSSYHNKGVKPEYRVLDMEGNVIVDWTNSTKINLPSGKMKGIKEIRAEARINESDKVVAYTKVKVKGRKDGKK